MRASAWAACLRMESFPRESRTGSPLAADLVMATQVPGEGSDMEVYEVGYVSKKQYHLMEAYDMTTEAALVKLMWILGTTKDPNEDPSQLVLYPGAKRHSHCRLRKEIGMAAITLLCMGKLEERFQHGRGEGISQAFGRLRGSHPSGTAGVPPAGRSPPARRFWRG